MYVPRIEPAVERLPKVGEEFAQSIQQKFWTIDNRYWHLPKNWYALCRAAVWAAGGALSVDVDAPLTTVLNLTRKGDRLCLHLVNYDSTHPVRGIGVDMQAIPGKEIGRVRLLSPDDGSDMELAFEKCGGRLRFFIPELRTYSVVVVELV